MYPLFVIVGWLVRQFLLPNPFEPLGEIANVLNYLFSSALVVLAYRMTGIIYKKGSAPAVGSVLFLLMYTVNNLVLYGICKCYPAKWLMVLLGVIYLVGVIFILFKTRNLIYSKSRRFI